MVVTVAAAESLDFGSSSSTAAKIDAPKCVRMPLRVCGTNFAGRPGLGNLH